MLTVNQFKSTILALSLFSATALVAAPEALPLDHEVSIDDYQGKTFLEAMIAKNTGIKSHLDEDFVQEYDMATWPEVSVALKNFDTKIVRRVMGAFDNDRDQLKEFVESIQGETFTPENIVGVLRSQYQGSGNIFALAHFFGMASGAGTLVHIDENNYYYNFGYKSGAEADDVKSGRSYGAGPSHNANDASDIMYLNELEQLLTSQENPREFYETVLEIVTQSDASEFHKLSDHGETTATDLIAIYTAELDRHIMVDLNPSRHPWENDLLEATFVAIYSAKSGKLWKGDALVEAPLRDYWAKSQVSNRSGIGIGRKDRRALQRQISAYLGETHSELVEEVEALIGGGRKDGDLFRGLTEYINNYDNQREVKDNADEIVGKFVELLMQVRSDADAITEYVQG